MYSYRCNCDSTTNVSVDEDTSLVAHDTGSIGKYLPTILRILLSPYPLQDGISQTQRMKAASFTGMLPISTVLFQDLAPISGTKFGGGEWLRQVLHSNKSYKNKLFLVPLSFCGPDTKHVEILRNSFGNLTNMYGNHACKTLERLRLTSITSEAPVRTAQ